MDESERLAAERRHKWLGVGRSLKPEELAAFVEDPQARWAAATETGLENGPDRHTAYLKERAELPFWAFALAKSLLDDVGEWPLFGMRAEMALEDYAEHGDPDRAVREILAATHPVWPDVKVLFIGEEERS